MPINDKKIGKYNRPMIFGPCNDAQAREFERIRKKYDRIEKLKKLNNL